MPLTRRQKWRIEKVQSERIARANKAAIETENKLTNEELSQTGRDNTKKGQQIAMSIVPSENNPEILKNINLEVIDLRKDWKNILTKELKDSFALGVTSMSGQDLIPAIEASKIAQGMNNKINIIWGGSHASALPEEVFEAGVTDYVLLGPAEFTFPKLLDSIYLKQEIPSDVKGILYKRNGKVIGNRKINFPVFHYEDSPAYHLLDIEKYRSKNNVVSYFKTRGCPYK